MDDKHEKVALQRWYAREGMFPIPGDLDRLREIYQYTTARGDDLMKLLNYFLEEAKKDYLYSLEIWPTQREFRQITREKGITHVPEILDPVTRKRIKELIAKKPAK